MKIANVTAEFLLCAAPIPVREPAATTDYGVLLVTVETDTGLTGIGIAREHDFQSASIQQVVLHDIATYLKKQASVHPGAFAHNASFDLPGADFRFPSGMAGRAAAAIDQALWDIEGQLAGLPVYRLLGGAQSEVEIYATFGLNIYTQEEEVEAARRLKLQGFKAFKLQGAAADRGRDISVDARRVRKLRETVGDDARVILDGRNNYSLYQATALAKAIEPYNPAFFDEPLFGRDVVALSQLRKAVPRVPIAGRSRAGNIWDSRDLIAAGALDLMGQNVLDQGGYTHGIKVAHMAEMFGLSMVTGGAWHHQNSHLIAAVTNGWMTEYHSYAAYVTETIFVDPPKPQNGKLKMSDRPGLGLTLNDAAVRDARDRARSAAKKG